MVYTVRIDPHPDDKNKYAEEKQYRTDQLDVARRQVGLARWLNIISGVAGAIAFLAFVAFLYYAGLVRETNKIAKTASDLGNRPYIGIDQIVVRFSQTGTSETTDMPTAKTDALNITAQIKNFGPVPGVNYTAKWKMFLGNKEVRAIKVPDTPFTLFPTQVMSLGAKTYGSEYRAVAKGEVPLTIEVTITYDGPTGHTEECDKAQYLPEASRFARLGPCPAN